MRGWYGSCFGLEPMCYRHRAQRGFTLAELMVVVAMVAVLAVLAVYGVRKYVLAAKSSEPVYMIGLIKTAQEAWREEFHAYADVSTSIDTYYPMDTPNNHKSNWINPSNTDYARWNNLGVSTPNPVQFGYATKAGGPSDSYPGLGTIQTFTKPANGEPWFVVKAAGDRNEDGKFAIFVSTDTMHEVYGENETE